MTGLFLLSVRELALDDCFGDAPLLEAVYDGFSKTGIACRACVASGTHLAGLCCYALARPASALLGLLIGARSMIRTSLTTKHVLVTAITATLHAISAVALPTACASGPIST